MGMGERCGAVIMQSEPASSQCTDLCVGVDGIEREMRLQWAEMWVREFVGVCTVD